MPWTTDENGERKYKVSLYAKEELPTWGEVYEWLKTKGSLIYVPSDVETHGIDPYWKVPSLKYKLAIICNQFNKMIFEDGMLPELLDSLHNAELGGIITDVRFVIEPLNKIMLKHVKLAGNFSDAYNEYFNEMIHRFSVGDVNTPPPIYTVPLPTRENNPFITNDFPRTNINDLNDFPLMIMPILNTIVTMNDGNIFHHVYVPDPIIQLQINDDNESRSFTNEIYTHIIAVMSRKFRDYFENGVGWKDENGELIEKESDKPLCQGVGADPAL